jgi:hypothetical protein
MKEFTDEQLVASPTLQKLSVLSQINPINTNDQTEVNGKLASALVILVDAMDRDAIQCSDRDDKNALWQMMFVCHQIITQIRPNPARIH